MERQNLSSAYLELIYEAMVRVETRYCKIKVAESNEEISRERVYCYELYHQMRKLQERRNNAHLYGKKVDESQIVINGEIDKAGHPVINPNFNPDFVIHRQKIMDNNICVVEVKTNYSKPGITKDFGTITCMMNCYRYEYGVFIYVGEKTDRVKSVIREYFLNAAECKCEKLKKDRYKEVYIYLANEAECAPEIFTLQEILEEN